MLLVIVTQASKSVREKRKNFQVEEKEKNLHKD